MPGSYDSTGIEESSPAEPFPEGDYTLRIHRAVAGKSKAGNDMVEVNFKVVGGKYDGREVRYYYVVFLPKDAPGAGMAVHFLKCIGEPFEGKFRWDERKWIGREIEAEVVIEPDKKGRKWNRVKSVRMKAGQDADLPPDDGDPF